MSKLTIVGAGGSVGATAAEACARRDLANEVIMLDVAEGVPQGKALDLTQVAPINLYDSRLTGSTNDYAMTAGSDVVIITAGRPRKPGMTREELIGTNASIVSTVTENILKHSPDAILIVVTNPMDTMTYHALKSTGLPKNRIIGMGGILDMSRYKAFLSMELNCSPKDLQGFVIGGHGDTTMIPLPRFTSWAGMPITDAIPADRLEAIVQRTMKGGAELTGLIGTSAWYAPGNAAALLAESVIRDQKRLFPCSVLLEGEYGQKDICLGVPVVVGKNGWEKVVELDLNDDEKAKFQASADAVRGVNGLL